MCIEGAQPEGLEGKTGADGAELSYLYGREDRYMFIPYQPRKYLMIAMESQVLRGGGAFPTLPEVYNPRRLRPHLEEH